MDLYFSEQGDIKISPNGDIAVTETVWRDDAQQIYIRIMTDPGDYLLYTKLGANMESLYGMPQSSQTGELGKNIIMSALEREGRFQGKTVSIKAVPTGPQSIRFDVYMVVGSKDNLIMSIEKDLGVIN